MPKLPEFEVVYGVDYSGAKFAGRNTWVARLEPRRPRRKSDPAFALTALDRLEARCGTAAREVVLPGLVHLVAESAAALWGFDCPFGLPVELFPAGAACDDSPGAMPGLRRHDSRWSSEWSLSPDSGSRQRAG